jgi:hypothetical protein
MTGCGGPGVTTILGLLSAAIALPVAARPPIAATKNIAVHVKRSKVMPTYLRPLPDKTIQPMCQKKH